MNFRGSFLDLYKPAPPLTLLISDKKLLIELIGSISWFSQGQSKCLFMNGSFNHWLSWFIQKQIDSSTKHCCACLDICRSSVIFLLDVFVGEIAKSVSEKFNVNLLLTCMLYKICTFAKVLIFGKITSLLIHWIKKKETSIEMFVLLMY